MVDEGVPMRCDGPDRGSEPDRAELDALLTVIAATINLAERTRSEAATALLRRAMTLVRDRGATSAERSAASARDFRAF